MNQRIGTLFLICGCVFPVSAQAAEEDVRIAATKKASAYLLETGQAEDGSFSAQVGPAITGLVITSLIKSGTTVQSKEIQQALKYLLSFKQADGGIHPQESLVSSYETAIAMMALVTCNADGQFDSDIQAAEAFIRGLQWDGSEGHTRSDPAYGGAGYGRKNRPDLSNTSFLIEALRASGNGEDDPAIQRALIFVSRTQNLEGPNNTLPFASKNPDGGFYYTPAAGGESKAGVTASGGLRSYGSMTYAGLKSMIFAGLSKEDSRVKAATTWLRQNYTFEENPGLGTAGLYYFFHTAAKALDALGNDTFIDDKGIPHVWKRELADAIIARQLKDGSWINDNPRWMEGDPNLVTAYALLALSYCKENQAHQASGN